jgi:hypothetical protein
MSDLSKNEDWLMNIEHSATQHSGISTVGKQQYKVSNRTSSLRQKILNGLHRCQYSQSRETYLIKPPIQHEVFVRMNEPIQVLSPDRQQQDSPDESSGMEQQEMVTSNT